MGQIKNIVQEKKPQLELSEDSLLNNETINSFEDLLDICASKKEIKLKYELEKNVNLVSFQKQKIEISFNEDLDKEFIKELSTKLYEWTGDRWVIALTKEKGDLSKKEKEIVLKKNFLEGPKKKPIYSKVLQIFPDAELIDVKNIKEEKND